MILGSSRRGHDASPRAVEALTPEVAASLRLSSASRFSRQTLANHVRRFPGLSWAIPGESAYVIGGRWRLRREIGEVIELSDGPWRHLLFDRLVEGFRDSGSKLVVLDYEEQSLDLDFYLSKGFVPIERIVEYERRGTRHQQVTPRREIRRFGAEDLDQVLEVERESFPWLWWNSREDMERYVGNPNVTVLLDVEGGRAIGYAGITVRGSAAHLDRLAVRATHQGRGIGAALLAAALEELGRQGARHVALSTQADNYRSQALYERFGFRRTPWRYDVHGLWLEGEAVGGRQADNR